MDVPTRVVFNGVTYALMGKGKYYLSQSKAMEGRKRPKGLHVAIWEDYHGRPVPPGHDVHHKDDNTHNNDPLNLECLSRSQHRRLHPHKDPEKQLVHLARIRPLATAWKRSQEGRKYYSEQSKKLWESRARKPYICQHCGKPFQTRQIRVVKYCSSLCGYHGRANEARALRATFHGICVVCGCAFTALKPIGQPRLRTTCSRSCHSKLVHKNRSRLQPRS